MRTPSPPATGARIGGLAGTPGGRLSPPPNKPLGVSSTPGSFQVKLFFVLDVIGMTSSVTILGEIRHFGQILKVFGNFSRVYLILGQFLNLLREFCGTMGLIFILINGQTLEK